jgi:hypothetical protein
MLSEIIALLKLMKKNTANKDNLCTRSSLIVSEVDDPFSVSIALIMYWLLFCTHSRMPYWKLI